MGIDRIVLNQGNGTVKPKQGDSVRLEYTGYLFDKSNNTNYHQGKRIHFSKDREGGVFETAIGVGKVIKGWDVGVLEMSVGERSILTISSEFAYGDRGFPGLIPSNSALVFDVRLLAILGNSEAASSAKGVSGNQGQGQLS